MPHSNQRFSHLDDNQREICQAFERAWQDGRSPSLSESLQDVERADQPALLRELLQIEIQQRQLRQSSKPRSEYVQEFPAHTTLVAEIFDAFAKAETVDYSLNPKDDTHTPLVDGAVETIDYHTVENEQPAVGALNDYELLHEIARGGMGVVFKARQNSLNRIVALKMIKAGELAGDEEIKRFHTEAEAAAKLDHPHIVPVYDVGDDDGRHYFSMGFVDGQGLDAKLRDGPLSEKEAALLVQKISAAVQYAHERGIVHRDLKPSNVLIAPSGEPRITDFGLAKTTETDSSLTATGQVMGTPSYMPPEQAAGRIAQIGPLSDVYSLGAMLYCLLTGRPPFQSDSVLNTLRQVLEQDPVTPRQLNPMVSKDLETICLKCLEKDPDRRFVTAGEISAELQRFLRGEAILARPIRVSERAWRWCRRNPILATMSGAIAALLVSVLVVAVIGYATTTQALKRAKQSAVIAVDESKAAKQAQQDAEKQRTLAQEAQAQSQRDQEDAEAAQREVEQRLREIYFERGMTLCEQDKIAAGLLWFLRSMESTPVGRSDFERLIRLNIASWQPQLHTLRLPFEAGGKLNQVAISPDGQRVLTGSENGTAFLWNISTGKPIGPPLRHSGGITSVAFSPDGTLAFTGGKDRTSRFWDCTSGKLVGEIKGHRGWVIAAVFSPNGRTVLIASGGSAGIAQLWDMKTKERVGQPFRHGAEIDCVAMSPDGETIVTGGRDHVARLWNVANGDSFGKPMRHEGPGRIHALAFSPDGKLVLSGGRDKVARFWDAATGNSAGLPLRHDFYVHGVSFSADGKTAVTASRDTTARFWDVSTRLPIGPPLQHQESLTCVAHSPIANMIVTGSKGGVARLHDFAVLDLLHKTFIHEGQVLAVDVSPNGKTIVTVANTRDRNGQYIRGVKVQMWDAVSGNPFGRSPRFPRAGETIAFSADGKTLLLPQSKVTALTLDVDSGNTIADFKEPAYAAAFASDGVMVATGGGFKNEAQLWDVTGKRIGRPLKHDSKVWSVAFHPDKTTLLTGCSNGKACLWNIATKRLIGELLNHKGTVYAVGFSPDGRLIATGSQDKTVRFWNATSRVPVGRALQHGFQLFSLEFSPDGKILLTGGDNGGRFWDVATQRPIGDYMHRGSRVRGVCFSPDGKTAVTGSMDESAQVWRVPNPIKGNAERLRLWIQTITGMELSEDGAIHYLDVPTWYLRKARLEELGGPPVAGD